ncbi:MAG: hypothetical protein WC332_00275 [Clostridia bacterium]|jgi:hypothetical protein
MTLNEKLREEKTKWDIHSNYRKEAIEEVKEYNLAYRKETGKYPYNRMIADYILSKEKIDDDLLRYLETEVYLSQQDISRDEEIERQKEYLKNGWNIITLDVLDQFQDGQKIKAILCYSGLLGSGEKEKKLKVINFNGEVIFMPLTARTKGYRAKSLVYESIETGKAIFYQNI